MAAMGLGLRRDDNMAGPIMLRGLTANIVAVALVLMLGNAAASAAEQKSEGHPHKWLAVDESLADFVANGFQLKTVAYDSSETAPKAEPDVHYFLQKGRTLVRCDFRKREDTSFYWCYRLVKPGTK
jgi:hypothetical protein